MKKFAFTLQKILDLRQYAEDQAKFDLGRAVSVVNRINSDLHRLAHGKDAAEKERAAVLSGSVDVAALLSVENYIVLLDQKKEHLCEELAAAELAAAQKRGVFAEAMKKRAVLTNLYEQQYEEWKFEMEREEDIVLDEVGAHNAREESSY
jgi:flagellar FliJ protein